MGSTFRFSAPPGPRAADFSRLAAATRGAGGRPELRGGPRGLLRHRPRGGGRFGFFFLPPRGFHESGGMRRGASTRDPRGGGVRAPDSGEKYRKRENASPWGLGSAVFLEEWMDLFLEGMDLDFFFLPASSRAPPHVSLCIFLGRWSCIAGILSCPKLTFRPFDFPISVHFQMGCEK